MCESDLVKKYFDIFFRLSNYAFLRDDDEDENANTPVTKKRKSEVVETTTTTTKTLFSYFAQKNVTKNDAVTRRVSGSHFFRAAHLKPAVFQCN